jgi:hypothetical protein
MPPARRPFRTTLPVALVLLTGLALALPAGIANAHPAAPDGLASGSVPAASASDRRAAARVTRILVVSIDGLNTTAIKRLGPRRTPVLHRLIKRGASTLNARTEYEQTNTLPNHTGMVTGRRVDAAMGGHGVTWNDERTNPATVRLAAGEDVESVFSVVESAGRSAAMFVSKRKLMLFDRSWTIDHAAVQGSNPKLVTMTRHDLLRHSRAFTFVHLSLPDSVGHQDGYMSPAYLNAVATTDRTLGRLVRTVNRHRKLKRHLTLIVTSDHGGRGLRHNQAHRLVNYRIPFIVWGPGVARGTNLYALNSDYANPGRSRPTYDAAKPPVRNGAVANLATDLLGLPPVSGSLFDVEHDLDVTR